MRSMVRSVVGSLSGVLVVGVVFVGVDVLCCAALTNSRID